MEHLVAMFKKSLMGLAFALFGGSLIGCQHDSNLIKQTQPHLSAASIKVLESPLPTGLVALHCTGMVSCEFAKLNDVVVVNDLTKQITNEAISASIVRFESTKAADQLVSKYFVGMQPGKNEIKLRFYPITADRAENFSLIHSFRAGKTYQVSMYRKHPTKDSSSVLNIATPEPLCVQLHEDEKVVRRFCRPFDPSTGLGEFIEQRVTSS